MLLFVRHPPVLVEGLCYGQAEVPTVPIDEIGEAFGRCVDEITQQVQGRPLSVLSSPSFRAAVLAEHLAAALPHAQPPRMDARLLEISMGVWEARTFAEIEDTDRARFEHWMQHWQIEGPPGGETLSQLVRRVGECLAELPEDGDHLLVTHAGVIRAYWVLSGEFDWMAAMHQTVPFLGVFAARR